MQLGGDSFNGQGVFDVGEIGPSGKFQRFELFQKTGSSTWTLTGSGAQNWTISGGTLQGDTQSLQGNILNNSILVFNQAFDGTFGAAISGTGFLLNEGPGAVTLSGTSSFSGGTIVGRGGLFVDGSLANSGVVVGGTGVLGGTGTVGSITVFPGVFDAITGEPVPGSGGGTIAPGHNSIGTLTAVRDVRFLDAGTFQVDVNAAGQSDRLAVGGRAILAGTVQILAAQELYAPQTTYTILTAAGGVTGRFGAVFTNLAFLVPELAYTATDVTLTLRRNDLEFSRAAVTPNQASAGRAAEALGFGNPVFNAILGLRATEARGAFDLLSGEVHASAVTAAVEESRLVRDALLDRLRGLGTPAAGGQTQSAFASYAADAPGPRQAVAVPVQPIDPRVFAVWGQGFGAFGRTDGEAGTAALKRSTGGFILGADATFDERWRAGVAGGYTRTSIDVASRLSSAAIESVHGAVYGGANLGAVQLRAGAAIAGQDVTASRAVAFRGFADGLRAGYDQTVLQAFGEAGYRVPIGAATVEPFGQLAALRVGTDGFREGGGAAALQSFARTHEVGFSTLGVRAEARLGMDTPFVARGLVGWRRAFGDTTPTALLGFPGGALPFVIAGAPIARDSLVAEAGLDYRIGQTAALGVSYAGALAQDAQDHTFKGRFEIQF
ncbi:MAG: autotransporter domain-containing protein [Microvirga sp.]